MPNSNNVPTLYIDDSEDNIVGCINIYLTESGVVAVDSSSVPDVAIRLKMLEIAVQLEGINFQEMMEPQIPFYDS